MAEQEMRARVVWEDGLQFTGWTASGGEVPLDTHKQEDGSGGQGLSPAELLPVALAGCTAMDVISILQKMQQQVYGFEVEVDFERAEEHPRRFTSFRVTYHISGTDVEPERVERAISLSRDRYCSVEATLEPAVPITHFYTIDDSDPVRVASSAEKE